MSQNSFHWHGQCPPACMSAYLGLQDQQKGGCTPFKPAANSKLYIQMCVKDN